MSHFYVGSNRALDCFSSRDFGRTITISGAGVEDDAVKSFTGVVQSIDHEPKSVRGREWSIIMTDTKARSGKRTGISARQPRRAVARA